MSTPIVIVDYGMGNLRSVQKAFEQVGFAAEISAEPEQIADAQKLVLPGVGAFRDAIAKLREANLVAPIKEHLQQERPFLGICLGLQLLFMRSYEDGDYLGLDLLPGEVVRLKAALGSRFRTWVGTSFALWASVLCSLVCRLSRTSTLCIRIMPSPKTRRWSPPRPIIQRHSARRCGGIISMQRSSTPRRARRWASPC